MILLVSNSKNRVETPSDQIHVGDFISPRQYKLTGTTPFWAADNDAFSGFDSDRYLRMLDAAAEAEVAPQWITVPDVVGDHDRTMEMWHKWKGKLLERNLPPAFVLQNGIEDYLDYHLTQWSDWILPPEAACYFIGGDNHFKFSKVVEFITGMSNGGFNVDGNPKWMHMGRVNSVRRMNWAKKMGCDSCDGSGMARFTTSVLHPMIRALKGISNKLHDPRQLTFL
jgi:hypothetical protein